MRKLLIKPDYVARPVAIDGLDFTQQHRAVRRCSLPPNGNDRFPVRTRNRSPLLNPIGLASLDALCARCPADQILPASPLPPWSWPVPLRGFLVMVPPLASFVGFKSRTLTCDFFWALLFIGIIVLLNIRKLLPSSRLLVRMSSAIPMVSGSSGLGASRIRRSLFEVCVPDNARTRLARLSTPLVCNFIEQLRHLSQFCRYLLGSIRVWQHGQQMISVSGTWSIASMCCAAFGVAELTAPSRSIVP